MVSCVLDRCGREFKGSCFKSCLCFERHVKVVVVDALVLWFLSAVFPSKFLLHLGTVSPHADRFSSRPLELIGFHRSGEDSQENTSGPAGCQGFPGTAVLMVKVGW